MPTADYMLALKLEAMRLLDPVEGVQEARDIANLMSVVGVTSSDQAIAILRRYFPQSAAASEK